MPDDHPDKGGILNSWGSSLKSRYEKTGLIDDLNEAISARTRAFESVTGPLWMRLQTASSCCDLLVGRKDYKSAKAILEKAVRLLPVVSPSALKRTDQQYNISKLGDIASRGRFLEYRGRRSPNPSIAIVGDGQRDTRKSTT